MPVTILYSEALPLIEALKFYADKENWRSPSTGFVAQYDPAPSPIEKDRGALARELIHRQPRAFIEPELKILETKLLDAPDGPGNE